MDIVPERVTRLLDWLVPAETVADILLIQFCVAAAMDKKILRRLVKVIFLHLRLSETDCRYLLSHVRGSLPYPMQPVLSTSPEKSGGENSTESLEGSEPLVAPPSPFFVEVAVCVLDSSNASARELSPDTAVKVGQLVNILVPELLPPFITDKQLFHRWNIDRFCKVLKSLYSSGNWDGQTLHCPGKATGAKVKKFTVNYWLRRCFGRRLDATVNYHHFMDRARRLFKHLLEKYGEVCSWPETVEDTRRKRKDMKLRHDFGSDSENDAAGEASNNDESEVADELGNARKLISGRAVEIDKNRLQENRCREPSNVDCSPSTSHIERSVNSVTTLCGKMDCYDHNGVFIGVGNVIGGAFVLDPPYFDAPTET